MGTQFVRSGVNDNLIPEKWETVDYEYAYKANPLTIYASASGQSSYGDRPFMITRELGKGVGDRITIPMIQPIIGDGETDDGDYDTNAEKLDFLDSTVVIHERGITVATEGSYTIQINYHGKDLPGGVTRKQLADWVGRTMYSDQIAAISGIPATTTDAGWSTGVKAVDSSSDPIMCVNAYTPSATATGAAEYALWFTSNKSTTHPRIFCGGQSSAGVLARVANDAAITAWSSDAHRMGTKVIDAVLTMAKEEVAVNSSSTSLIIPPIEPIMEDGGEHYILLIGTDQMKDLRNDPAWINAQNGANIRGKTNPIFSGIAGLWNGVIVKECSRMHKRLGAGGTTTSIAASEYFDGIPYSATYTSNRDQLASGVRAQRAVFFGKNALVQAFGSEPIYNTGYLDSGSLTKPSMHTHFIYGLKTPTFAYLNNRARTEEAIKYPVGVILVDTCIQ